MRRRPPISTRTDTPLPYPTLFRSQPWVAVPIPDAAKVTRLIDNADAVDVRLSKVIAAQNTSPPASEDRDIDVLDDRGSRNIRHMRIRSEEHTSELQSLMRRSYAVFCLQKKNNKIQQ